VKTLVRGTVCEGSEVGLGAPPQPTKKTKTVMKPMMRNKAFLDMPVLPLKMRLSLTIKAFLIFAAAAFNVLNVDHVGLVS
jgi:hypothetical protein